MRRRAALPACQYPDIWTPNGLDVFVFAAPDSSGPSDDYLAQALAQGRRVYCFHPTDRVPAARKELHPVPTDGMPCRVDLPMRPVAGGQIEQRPWQEALDSLLALVTEQAVEEAICIVRHPIWEPVVAALRNRYGWRVVVEPDSFHDIVDSEPALEAVRKRLLAGTDMVFSEYLAADPAQSFWSRVDRLYGRVSIIIVSYNGLDLIKQCIASILERTLYPNYEIIVVDNASMPEVRAYLADLEKAEGRVRVIYNDSNKGFAAANNVGLQYATGSEFIVLLNNDTVVPRGWLCRLLRYARRPEVGIVGPVTNWTGNEAKIDVSYQDLRDMPAFAQAYTQAHEGKAFDIGVLAMYCVAMRRDVVDQIGPLDERFGVGMFEDDDYARRVRQAGYRVICAEDVFVHHHGMASFAKLGEAEYRSLFERNKRLYEEKWGEPWGPHQGRTS